MAHTHAYPEIMRQPETWADTLELILARREELTAFVRETAPDEVLFTGCGSSHYLSMAAAVLFGEITGMATRAVPASEVFLNPQAVFRPGARTLVVGTSRSGNTTEVVRALRFVRERGLGRTMAVTAYPESQLAGEADVALTFPHVQEASVVMTGSFSNKLLALQLLAACLAQRDEDVAELKRLPAAGKAVLSEADRLAKRTGEDLSHDRVIYLGMGAYFGLANEGMLKLKEMTQLAAEAYHPLEFRHGPISVVTERCRIVLLASRAARAYEQDLVRDLRRLGAQTVVLGEAAEELAGDVTVELPAGFTDRGRAVLYLPYLQLMAYHRTLKMGLNPDKPRHLSQVVVLKS